MSDLPSIFFSLSICFFSFFSYDSALTRAMFLQEVNNVYKLHYENNFCVLSGKYICDGDSDSRSRYAAPPSNVD